MGQDKVRSLEAALGALGPEDTVAKEQIQEALRRAKEGRQPVRVNPDTVKAEAAAKVERLQKALDASGALGGREVDAFKKALKKAQEVARERPVAELVKECTDFIERSTKRISKLKTELEAETGLLEDSRARLTRLEAQSAPAPVQPPDWGAQVDTLQSERRFRPRRQTCRRTELLPDDARNRESAWDSTSPAMVPGEFSQWLEERQEDLQDAFAREDDVGVLELTSKMAKVPSG